MDSWPTTVTSLGARLALNGEWQLYAPFGLEDLFQHYRTWDGYPNPDRRSCRNTACFN
ncbi:nucleotidyltransferase family protein [Paenibacillus tritici]|uniref:nucleotidyltransferase family protein n=1 Tax=Paenibacillus tritici TaxID=1873425 RepID=UPI002484AB77|nr:nucleotidyltransferase family protein [Paenibacillus tritici]